MVTLRNISIAGTGKYLPSNVVHSSSLDIKLNQSPGSVEKKSGIQYRHFIDKPYETTSYMATQAALEALKRAGIEASQLDCIIGACGVQEQLIPSTASLVHKQLGLEDSGIPAFDINSTCTSFLTALDMASYAMALDRFKRVLIFSSDISSAGLDWENFESSLIFGDGAAAVVLEVDNNKKGILASYQQTFSKGNNYCKIEAGGTKLSPSNFNGVGKKESLFQMDGKASFKLISLVIDEFIEKLFSQTRISLQDIDCLIPHQASLLALHHIRKRLGIPPEKLMEIYPTHGNQVAASLPTALHEAIIQNKLHRGDTMLLLGTGAGISINGIIMEY